MLVLNIWEGAGKWSLINGSSVYGHAAMVIPKQGAYTDACYLSWWPGGENSEGEKHGKSEDRQKDRSFNEDLWAENNHRFLGTQVFTLPLSVCAELDSFMETGRQDAKKVVPLPAGISKHFTGNHAIGPNALLGALIPGEHWLIDDPDAKKAYLLYHGKKELKVTHLEGHRFLFEEAIDAKEAEAFVPSKKDRIDFKFPKLQAFLKQKVPALAFDAESYAGRMSRDQIYVDTKKSTGYVSITPGKDGKSLVRYYHWTRQYLAPTVNIELPTLSEDKKGLDDVAIRRWWAIFNAPDNPKWSTFERNCSVIVMTALKVGGASKYATPHLDASWLCWTPSDVRKYGEAIKKGIEAGAKPPKPVPNAKPIPNLDLGTGTIVWTKKQFEKASKLKGLIDARSGALQKIDKGLDEYHAVARKDGTTFKKRAEVLGTVLDNIAEFTAAKPDSKRASAVYSLAERVIAERVVMIRDAAQWSADAKARAKAMAVEMGLDIDIDSF